MTDKITVDRELLQKICNSLDSRCGTNAPERTEIIPVLIELLDAPVQECGYDETTGTCVRNPCCAVAPAVEPSCRTDQQIVDQTEELAKFLLFWKYAYEPENETLMREAIHPKAEDSWQAARRVQEMLTDTDPMNAVAEVDDEPAPVQEPVAELDAIKKEIAETCMNTPPGWRCTRKAGHDGPCAAVYCPEDIEWVQKGMERLREGGYLSAQVQEPDRKPRKEIP